MVRGEDAYNQGLPVQEPNTRNTDPTKVCIPCAHRDHSECNAEWGEVCACRCRGVLARASIRAIETMLERTRTKEVDGRRV